MQKACSFIYQNLSLEKCLNKTNSIPNLNYVKFLNYFLFWLFKKKKKKYFVACLLPLLMSHVWPVACHFRHAAFAHRTVGLESVWSHGGRLWRRFVQRVWWRTGRFYQKSHSKVRSSGRVCERTGCVIVLRNWSLDTVTLVFVWS